LEKLDEKKLSKKAFVFEDIDGKQKEIPSEKEKWYSIKAKALEKLERYKDCIDLCENSLTDIDGFHYSGDIWQKRRIALCKYKLGRKDEAAEGLELILQQRKEWFIQHELARIYYELGKNKKAIKVAIDSALNFGKDENKWELFLLLARLLVANNRLDEAKMHLLFAAELRKKNEWKIPENLAEEVNKLKLDINDPINIGQLRTKLKSFWENEKYSALPKMAGTVKTILKNGKAGFISGSDGKNYYFNISSFKGAKNKLARGLMVSFVIEDSYDKKKKMRSKAATHIYEIQ
jgi:cold shock CspA family protein